MTSFFDRLMSNQAADIRSISTLSDLRLNIENLLNHTRLSTWVDEDSHLSRCVLNYGLPSLAGSRIDSASIPQIASEIEQALIRFEPRLESQSISVRVSSQDMGPPGTLMFNVDGRLRHGQVEFHLQLTFDVHFGWVNVMPEMCT
jgi:type VI secretion system lysozyme-like protein